MINDCFKYYKGCEACQKFGDIQLAPAAMLHPIVKPWPFRGWGLDFIGQIHPSSSKGHRFVLVATDYFTKWSEAVPLKNMAHVEVIRFITEHIVHRFGIPQTLTTDQGSSFMSHQVREFAESYNIKLLNSIIKPWPFRGWALDFIGMIHPASSKGHRFVLVATDYFTK